MPETILLVEDEFRLRVMLENLLQQDGYRIIPAANATEALQLWARHSQEIDLVLTDLIMPEGMNGLDLSQKLRAERPNLKIVYTSGFRLDSFDERADDLVEGLNFVQKPFRRETLAKTVRRSLALDE